MLQKPALLFILLLASCVAAACAITSESFWIDELMSAFLITSDSIADYNERIGRLSTSDIQMPLYMLYAFAWEELSGDSELALRLSNVPWFLLGVYAFWRYFRNTPRLRLGAIAALVVSPFAWYCMNELRPYAMQLGSSCVVIGCGMRMILGWKRGALLNAGDLWLASFGIVAMAGCTMLSVPWIGAFGLLFIYAALRGEIRFSKAHLIASGICAGLALAGLGVYYLTTLSQGARAATYAGNPLVGFAFSAYELLGFAGLGPGRTDLRQLGAGVITPLQIGLVAALALLLLFLGVRFLQRLPKSRDLAEKTIAWGLLLGPPLLFMLVLAFVKDFRVLGRHLTPLFPVVALFLGAAVAMEYGKKTHVSTAVALFGLLLASCFSLRLAERHRKDDYRSAAAIVKEETGAGHNVLWVASMAAVPYYNLYDAGIRNIRAGDGPDARMHPSILLLGQADTSLGLRPSKVIVSKPDIHDPGRFADQFVKKEGYRVERRFPGFTVWMR